MNAEELANQHWEWLEKLLEYIYKSAFIHGFKHGEEENEI